MVFAFYRGTANVWYFKAEYALNEWAENGVIANKADYLETLNAITKAQTLDPNHPHYAHMVGRITHWGVDMGFEEKAKLHEVKAWYLSATEIRPLWPDPWIDLARLNNYLAGYTTETKLYIEQALKTGPYINLVTKGTLQVLMLNWNHLSGTEKRLLFDQFSIAVKQPKLLTEVLSLAKDMGRETLLCNQLKFNPAYKTQKESNIYNRYCSG